MGLYTKKKSSFSFKNFLFFIFLMLFVYVIYYYYSLISNENNDSFQSDDVLFDQSAKFIRVDELKGFIEKFISENPELILETVRNYQLEQSDIEISESEKQNKELINHKIDQLIARFELDAIRDVKSKFLSGGQKKKLVIALALLSQPKVLLLDECFAALDVLTIKMLQEIIVNLQSENNITICICDHQARDLLSCVDVAVILSNCKIIAQGSPNDLVNNADAKNAYFGDSFKFN